jgi:hypothetical protein
MATATAIRTRTKRADNDRVTLAEAALGPIAGALVGYATFGIIVMAVSAFAAAFDGDLGVIDGQGWREAGLATAIVTGAMLLVAYLYGGFVAGRMARTGGSLSASSSSAPVVSPWPSERRRS